MKEGTQKIGKRTSARGQITIRVTRPETWAELVALCAGNETAAMHLAWRGLDIARQDKCGRSMFDEGATESEIEAAVAKFVPGTTKGRGRPAKAKVVNLPKPSKDGKMDAEAVAIALAKAGITVKSE
jgi:hypothetical protein